MSALRRPPISRREDPGEAWTEETLAPLRRLQIRCEIAPAVMARVAEARARRAVPVVFAWP
ncbi:MAG TPA: hypothetical protein VJ144_11475, partial [Candidatus Polarisedimenticolia bacterium]|nr:hypothetical protein [Candidatus Polarisedimenticolia bacterium]